MPVQALKGISSMATRQLLAVLLAAWHRESGVRVDMESVGGVDAARRVQAGEPFDVVMLASDAINKLVTAGKVLAGSELDLVHCGVAVAVRAGEAVPDISTEAALKAAVQAAPSLGYSTGPSGVALLKLFERWGLAEILAARIVQAKPGMPVGSLLASGEVALGFQQLSELMHLPGITVVGPLPDAVQIITTFSAGICATSMNAEAVRAMLAFMASADTADAKRQQGMEPA